MNNEVPELFDIAEQLQSNAYRLWERIEAMEGERFTLTFRCNSQQVRAAHIQYTPRAVMKPRAEQSKGAMPHEAADIVDACKNNARLKKAIRVVSSSKVDIYFVCEHYALINWGFEEVS